MKKYLIAFLTVALLAVFCLSFAACAGPANTDIDKKIDKNTDNDNDLTSDDGYILTVSGIGASDILIYKSDIKELFKSKPVVFTAENPVYASDKTDDNGNAIPHTLEGVYLDDLLSVYADGAVSGAFSSMTLDAGDGFQTVLTSDTFSTEHGGSKMIVALNYDGNVLNSNAKSGSLRAVFPNQVANSWAKKLIKITFGNAVLLPPAPLSVYFAEDLGADCYGEFTKEAQQTGGEATTYYGISLKKLFEKKILKGGVNDKMFLSAWDYVSNGTDSFYREYLNWKSYELYSDAYLVYETASGSEQKTAYGFSPAFNGANIQSGMSVKNVLSLSVSDTALVSLKIAFERFGSGGSFEIKELLTLINMLDNEATYTVTKKDGSIFSVSGTEIQAATVTKSGEDYILHCGAEAAALKKITINK